MKLIAIMLISSLAIFSYTEDIYLEAFGSVKKVVVTDSLASNVKNQSKPKQLSLVLLPLKKLSSSPADIEELKCFLINKTDTTTIISREDITISDIQSELFIKSKWIRFQPYRGATCGNSYWKQKLNAKHSLAIEFVWGYYGKVKLPLRLVYNHQGKHIYSNEIQIKVPKEIYSYVISKAKL